jgi:enoyl-CoA hydratase
VSATSADSPQGSVDLELDGPVAVITVRAAHRRNALNGELAEQFLAHLAHVRGDDGIGAVLVATEGPHFCAGGDFKSLAVAGEDPTSPVPFAELGKIYRIFTTLLALPVPTVVAVQGSVVGAGVNLMVAPDLAVVSHDVKIRGFGGAGMHPGGGHLSMLLRKAPSAAAALALLGQEMGPDEALRTGLAWEVTDRESLFERALDIARTAAADPELARMVTATYRAAGAQGLTGEAAVMLERAPQMWSLRRATLARGGSQ